jgi:hypothetical protein
MIRRVLIVLEVLSAALLLAVAVAWVDSAIHSQPWERRWKDGHHAWVSHQGKLTYLRWGYGDLPWITGDSRLIADNQSLPSHASGLGFHFFNGLRNDDVRYARATIVSVPYWFLALLTALPLLRCTCAVCGCPKDPNCPPFFAWLRRRRTSHI